MCMNIHFIKCSIKLRETKTETEAEKVSQFLHEVYGISVDISKQTEKSIILRVRGYRHK